MNKQKASMVIAVALMASLAAGCATGSGSNFNLISIDEEWQLGQQVSQEVAQQVKFNHDATVNAYVRDLGRKIVASSPAPFNQLPWEFYVVEDPAINAFSIPGGRVYVNTGLIATAENASELAGVIAHEASHVVARHSTEQITRQYGISVLAGLLLGQNPGAAQEIGAQIIAGAGLARFSRDNEREADQLGIAAMHRAGYDPRGMAAMFRLLQQQQQSQPSRVAQFFASHPTTEERIRDAEARAAQLSTKGKITDEPQFQSVRRRVGG